MRMILLGLAGISLLAGGCVSTQGHKDTIDLLESERMLNGQLKTELLAREAQIADLETANREWQDSYNRALELASAPGKTEVIVQQAPLDTTLDELRDAIGRDLTTLDGFNVIRASHAVGVRLDDGSDVLFMPGSWKLTDKASQSLTKLATALKQTFAAHPDYVARIDGHTDSDPIRRAAQQGIQDNTHLGFMRAHAVMQFLVDKGLPKNRLFVLSAGEHIPVGADKKLNRRVEIWVSNPEGFSLNARTGGGAPKVNR